MTIAEQLEKYLTDDVVLICSDRQINPTKKPSAIYIKKCGRDGEERDISAILDQLTLYFKTIPKSFYYIENSTKIEITLNTKLSPFKTIWINY